MFTFHVYYMDSKQSEEEPNDDDGNHQSSRPILSNACLTVYVSKVKFLTGKLTIKIFS